MKHLSKIVIVILVVSLGFVSPFGTTAVSTYEETVSEEGLTLDEIYDMHDSNSKDTTLISVTENKYVYEIQNEIDTGMGGSENRKKW